MDATKSEIRELIDGLRGKSFFDERDVEKQLVEPCLKGIGWNLVGTKNQRTSIPEDKKRIWKQGYTIRDYILRSGGHEVLHVETKYRWSGWIMDLDGFLSEVNRDYWEDTDRNGPQKDLALVLWGADARLVCRAALMDEQKLIVLDKNGTWRKTAEANVFGSFEEFWAAFQLLSPP